MWQHAPTYTNQKYNTSTLRRTPQHVAIIMDGNRRWARKHNLPAWEGHRNGIAPLREAIQACLSHGIPYLSVYAFSPENFKRPQEEKQFLFNALHHHLIQEELPQLQQQGVRIRCIGDTKLFPETMQKDITYVQEATESNTQLQLNILFCYGGRHDIAHATRRISSAYANGDITQEDITPERFADYLWTADIPDPEVVIRTGGRRRISNFLLYQIAHSEIYFFDQYWPDITREDIESALTTFHQTTRTFGG